MNGQLIKIVLMLVGTAFAAAAWPQDSATDPATDSENAKRAENVKETKPYSPTLEQCFNVPGFTDMSFFSDRHMYVRTQGNNHYLVTT